MPFFLPTCSFIHMRLNSHKNFVGERKKIAVSFYFTFRYIDDVLSQIIHNLLIYVKRIFHIELEIKDTKDTVKSASYLDLHLEIDDESRLKTKFYDKRDDFSFPIVNFPFLCINIPAAPAYRVYISQLIRYSKACVSNHHLLDRGLLLTKKLLNQVVKLKLIPSLILRTTSRVGWPLLNICFDDGYVPIVVPFPRMWTTESDIAPGLYMHEQHDGCHMWSRICLPF